MRPFREPIVHHKALSFGHIIVALLPRDKHPAIGGMRRIEYNSLDEAILDCKKLATAMLHKSQAHQLPLSGGKAVIYCSNKDWAMHRLQIIQESALFIESLDGQYITAIDMGTHMKDMDHIALITEHVCAHSGHQETAYYTALGVYYALLAACERNQTDLNQAKILIEGLGQVSSALIKILTDNHSPELFGIDVNPDQLKAHSKWVKPYQSGQKIDIFCPNATGSSVSCKRITAMGCDIICGAANNQLVPEETIQQLPCIAIPDHIANGGGLIYVYHQINQSSDEELQNHIRSIKDRAFEYLETSCLSENAN
jgi:glutamate dehydrogenase/leucine dehydrogenase